MVPAWAQTDTDILNFALQLECLEGEFYNYAAGNGGLPASDRGGGPAPIGGRAAKLGGQTLVCIPYIHAYVCHTVVPAATAPPAAMKYCL